MRAVSVSIAFLSFFFSLLLVVKLLSSNSTTFNAVFEAMTVPETARDSTGNPSVANDESQEYHLRYSSVPGYFKQDEEGFDGDNFDFVRRFTSCTFCSRRFGSGSRLANDMYAWYGSRTIPLELYPETMTPTATSQQRGVQPNGSVSSTMLNA